MDFVIISKNMFKEILEKIMKKSKYSNPQFSIIIPCKNSYKYILKALDSIFIQNFNDFEILVIDDNSSDNSKELVTKWIENHLQMKEKLYKKSVSKRGPGGARNVGLLHAKGKYIIFLDAYDELLPGY